MRGTHYSSKTEPMWVAGSAPPVAVHDFGYTVPVLVISAKELNQVANSNPLWPKAGGDEKLFHTMFLAEPVSPASFKALKLPAAEDEYAVPMGRVVLLHCPHGYGNTKLNNNYFERMAHATLPDTSHILTSNCINR